MMTARRNATLKNMVKSLIKYQKSAGVSATGYLGPKTRAAIKAGK